jgi:hypothetical protein
MTNANKLISESCSCGKAFDEILKDPKLLAELQPYVYDDVILRHNPFLNYSSETNLRHYGLGYCDRFSWGYLGAGPHTLAQNILYHFSGRDAVFAKGYMVDFLADFLHHMPKNGGIIRGQVILKWIEDKKAEALKTNVIPFEKPKPQN